jgi:hypothetical protein
MTARSLASIAHLVKLCGMFGSAHAGERAHLLTPRERHFITTIGRMRTPPSDRQMAWLTAIYSRLREEAA